MHMPRDVASLEAEIGLLLRNHPELADDEELRADVLEGETDLHGTLERLLDRLLDAEADEIAIKHRMSELEARKHRTVQRQSTLRALISRIMLLADLRKVKLTEKTLSFRAVPGKVEIYDETALPEELTRVRKEPDKTKIKEALSNGQFVPGAVLTNGSETLSVR